MVALPRGFFVGGGAQLIFSAPKINFYCPLLIPLKIASPHVWAITGSTVSGDAGCIIQCPRPERSDNCGFILTSFYFSGFEPSDALRRETRKRLQQLLKIAAGVVGYDACIVRTKAGAYEAGQSREGARRALREGEGQAHRMAEDEKPHPSAEQLLARHFGRRSSQGKEMSISWKR